MDYIEWNYIQAKEQAEKLVEQADRLEKLSSEQLNATFYNLSVNWEGRSAEDFLKKGDALADKISQLEKEQRKIAAVIRSCAERTYQAELKARELAKTRTY